MTILDGRPVLSSPYFSAETIGHFSTDHPLLFHIQGVDIVLGQVGVKIWKEGKLELLDHPAGEMLLLFAPRLEHVPIPHSYGLALGL